MAIGALEQIELRAANQAACVDQVVRRIADAAAGKLVAWIGARGEAFTGTYSACGARVRCRENIAGRTADDTRLDARNRFTTNDSAQRARPQTIPTRPDDPARRHHP